MKLNHKFLFLFFLFFSPKISPQKKNKNKNKKFPHKKKTKTKTKKKQKKKTNKKNHLLKELQKSSTTHFLHKNMCCLRHILPQSNILTFSSSPHLPLLKIRSPPLPLLPSPPPPPPPTHFLHKNMCCLRRKQLQIHIVDIH